MRASLFVALLLVGCAPETMVQGRPYELQLPEGDDGQTPLPLLVLAHGYGVNGIGQDFIFPFSKQVDGRHFLYAIPHGTPDHLGRRFWNATEACCNFDELPVDDVAFFRALVDDVKARHPVQEGHVYLVGHSNGAFMALRLACDAPDLFDATVSVAGSTWKSPLRCAEGRASPLLLVHGDQDGTVPYAGRPGLYPGAVETGQRFARRNGCTGGFEEESRADFLGSSTVAETRQERIAGCPDAAPVELWTLEGEGHAPVFDARWTGATLDWLEGHSR